MTNYEIKMLDDINKKIKYLMKKEKYSPYDISVLLDDFIYNNEFSNECNQKLWQIQDKYISMYRAR